MTPGQKRRLDRRYKRNEATKAVSECLRGMEIQPNLREMPHPKRSTGTARDYVDWLIDNGYTHHAVTYLQNIH